jgi:flavin reductase (DIM6/NTAB) family NADH-FMN oxidoreductase RutF
MAIRGTVPCMTEFTKLVAELEYPMYVVTAAADRERAGCLVGFGTQTSIHPPRFLICISVKNRTLRVAEKASALAVHVLSNEPGERRLAELFGGETGDDTDKFEQSQWHEGHEGVPLLEGIPNVFVGRVLERLDLGGDHVGFVLDPVEAEHGEQVHELGFQEAKDIEPGHPA